MTGHTSPLPCSRSFVCRTAAAVLVTGFALSAGGCLVTTSNHTDVEGQKISSATLDQVVPGTTTEAWVRATLGEPTCETVVEDNASMRILRYDYSRKSKSGGSVFLLYAGSSSNEAVQSTYFELQDNIVQRFWTEFTH